MNACTFFGHRACCELDAATLQSAVERLIEKGVNTFYVGNQGDFDKAVYKILKKIHKKYSHIKVCVVLAYIPIKNTPFADMADTVYPSIEGCPRFAIERRNSWMIEKSKYCICCINKSWGGAINFQKWQKREVLK